LTEATTTNANLNAHGWRNPRDVAAGLTLAITEIPDGMASALLAGVSPAFGLYSVIAGGVVGALLVSTAMMSVVTTSALSVAAGEAVAVFGSDQRVAALAMLTVLVGGFQILLGALKLGFLTRFISNAVMTGFLAGIGMSIVLSQLSDLTGYSASGRSQLAKFRDLLAHPREIDSQTTVIGLATIAAMLLLDRTPLSRFSSLLGVAIATAAVALLGWDQVALVASMGEIPRSLPIPAPLDLGLAPGLLGSAVALGAVGLVQAAGVAQLYPNVDGSRGNPSRDFWAQGAANIAVGMVRGIPVGGSVSATALAVGSGAASRWANIWMAVFAALGVLFLADLLSIVPLTSLAALMILAGIGSLKPRAIMGVLRTSHRAAAIMIVTFVSVLVLGITQAVLVGFVLSVLSFVWDSAADVKIIQLIELPDGRVAQADPPQPLPAGQVTLLEILGDPFFAAAYALEEQLPDPRGAAKAAVVLRLRGEDDAGSTFLKVIASYEQRLRANGAKLFLAGVEPQLMEQLRRTGLADTLGTDAIFPMEAAFGAATGAAVDAAHTWVRGQHGDNVAAQGAR
jgi:SulP family sulfate permease